MDFDPETCGVIRSALGEAWGGFAARDFPATRRLDAKSLIDRLDRDPQNPISQDDEMLCKEALAFALRELGPEEFQTNAGYDFEFGELTLAGLG